MRLFSCTALGLMAAAATSPVAEAGGLGIDFIGGTHTTQQRPTWGIGLQAVLGDRDDDLIGIMRFGYINDLPASSDVGTDVEGFNGDAPSQITGMFDCADENADDSVCGNRAVGTVSAGLQWRVWGDPAGFQVSLLPSVGAGITTADSTEYIQIQFGPGAHYALSKELQVHAEVVYQARFRKSLTHGASMTTGVRWLFD